MADAITSNKFCEGGSMKQTVALTKLVVLKV